MPANADAARKKAPELTRIRCVPATSATCKSGVKVVVGRQLQISGKRVTKGMRVSFRWSRGALATKLDRSRVGYVARVPAGTRAGSVSVTVSDRAGRRSNAIKITVTAPPRIVAPRRPRPARCRRSSAATACGSGSSRSPRAATSPRSSNRARGAGISTVFVKSSDGAANRWAQFSPELVAGLKAQGLRVCAWQFVYGNDPAGEAALGVDAIAAGADCLVIDAESAYANKYAAAQQYMGALRATVGPAYPIGFTSFPYVDYHSRIPYSVFLGPGGANANLPQVYWQDIGGTVDAVSGRTLAQNRIYGVPIAPIGQTYGNVPPQDIAQFRALWAAYGSAGVSWWSWQATAEPGWAALAAPLTAPVAAARRPGLARAHARQQGRPGACGCSSGSRPPTRRWRSPRTFDDATDVALRAFQQSRGLPVTGTTDALTWQAVLSLPVKPVTW